MNDSYCYTNLRLIKIQNVCMSVSTLITGSNVVDIKIFISLFQRMKNIWCSYNFGYQKTNNVHVLKRIFHRYRNVTPLHAERVILVFVVIR